MRLQGIYLSAVIAAVLQLSCSGGDESKSESESESDAGGSGGGSGNGNGATTKNTSSSGTGGGNNTTSADSASGSGGSANTGGANTDGANTNGANTGGANTNGANTNSANTNGANTGSNADSTSATSGSGGSAAASTTGAATTGGDGTDTAKEVSDRLGRSHFLIGMGNDLSNDHNQDGAYSLGTTLDLHYAYLVGLKGQGGWPDWNEGGTFVNILTDTARNHGVVPMFSIYGMAAAGENNIAVLSDAAYMTPYWEGAKLLFERLAEFDDPAVVHLEPDFWAYAQHAQSNPEAQPVLVGSILPECASLPETMAGMGRCWIKLARDIAPKTLIGFHASGWAGETQAIVQYLNGLGADQADIVFTDMLDRDAGCFEAGEDPNCQRGGSFYWDATNQSSPNFHEHLAWAKAIADGVGKPMMWWQVPFGVPSDTPGGAAGHYRDNRVKYMFEHLDEFVAAGGVGAVFGVGAGNQTYIDTDGGQFQNAVTNYFAAPYQL